MKTLYFICNSGDKDKLTINRLRNPSKMYKNNRKKDHSYAV